MGRLITSLNFGQENLYFPQFYKILPGVVGMAAMHKLTVPGLLDRGGIENLGFILQLTAHNLRNDLIDLNDQKSVILQEGHRKQRWAKK